MLGRARLGLVLGLLTAFPAATQDLQKGTAAYARGDYATALREMTPLAEAGDARAQNNLGLMFHRGHGVLQDGALAAQWFRKAAERAHVSAQFNLAVMYLKGDGVPQDYGEAALWFRKAAGQGHPGAQYNLAVMYLKGHGVPWSEAEAVWWFRAAAALGHDGARKVLALFPSRGPEGAPPAPPEEAARGAAGAENEVSSIPAKTDTPAEQATGTPPAAAPGAFRIQLGAVRSQAVAVQEAERLNRAHGPILGDSRIAPVRADLGERGVFWRLRAGSFDDGATAKALCSRLAEREQACIVVRD